MKSTYTVNHLRCEFLENPLGIDFTRPDLSWNLCSENLQGLRQHAYRILVASQKSILLAGKGDLWDSGKVLSDRSTLIPYEGAELTSRQKCFWKVITWNDHGEQSESEISLWSMGLLARKDWKAQWIGLIEAPHYPDDWFKKAEWIWSPVGRDQNQYEEGRHWFAQTIEISNSLKSAADFNARIWCYGDDEALIFINGEKVGRAAPVMVYPGISPFFCLYPPPREFNITDFLKEGKNLVLIEGIHRDGGVQQPAGVIARLQWNAGSTTEEVITDGTWAHEKSQGDHDSVLRSNLKSWGRAASLGSFGAEPWHRVTPREFPNLPARYLRKEFNLSSSVESAEISISGLGHFDLFVNGKKVSDEVLAPHISNYHKRVLYRTYDIAPLLQKGPNVIGVILGNGWHFAPRVRVPFDWVQYGLPRCILQTDMSLHDGSQKNLVSDRTWKITNQGPLGWNNLFDGEIYDARNEFNAWCQAGFDDSQWKQAEFIVPPGGTLSAQMSLPQRVTAIRPPLQRTQKSPSRIIFDLGINMAGWSRVELKGKKGQKVIIRHAEKLDSQGELDVDNLRSALATETIYLGEQRLHYEPRFVYHGFRFAEVTVEGGPLEVLSLVGCEVHDDLPPVGKFDCSSPILNQIYAAMNQGIKSNYHSVPVDCPQRDERLGWLGDRGNGCSGEMYLFDVSTLYRKWMLDYADEQWPNGSIPDIAPPGIAENSLMHIDNVTWPSCTTFVPMALYRHYGDIRIIERQYPMIQKWIDHMATFIDTDGLIDRDNWGDWCVPPEEQHLILTADPLRKTAPAILASAYFYKNLLNIAFFAKLLGKKADETRFTDDAKKMKQAFHQRFFNSALGQYDNGSQTSFLLPLAFGLAPQEEEARLFENFLKRLLVNGDPQLGVGLIGIQWILRELTRRGRADIALSLATRTAYPSWGYMIEKGATTIWELWNGDTAMPHMNSANHVMLSGDLHIWIYECLGGIRPRLENPAFKHFDLAPHCEVALDFVRVEHQSPYGKIVSDWKKSEGKINWKFTVPANTTASIQVAPDQILEIRRGDECWKGRDLQRLCSGDYEAVLKITK